MKECALNTRRVLAHSDRRSSRWSEWLDIEEKPKFDTAQPIVPPSSMDEPSSESCLAPPAKTEEDM